MFGFLKKKSEPIQLVSPATGTLIALENVPDKVFASKMMGNGVAFELSDDTLVAPTDGEISLIPDSLHAFGMVGENGVEVLVHIGLDTVDLAGEGFTSYVKPGDKVKKGTPIVKVDRAALLAKNIVLATPMVITNTAEYDITINPQENVVAGETIVLECKQK